MREADQYRIALTQLHLRSPVPARPVLEGRRDRGDERFQRSNVPSRRSPRALPYPLDAARFGGSTALGLASKRRSGAPSNRAAGTQSSALESGVPSERWYSASARP